MKKHGERAHSKFSASGAERWFNCPGSVQLSEGLPDKSSIWAVEGTEAHEVLEAVMLWNRDLKPIPPELKKRPREMFAYANEAADFILGMGAEREAEVMVETRIYLDFIHPEMFGTFDGAVVEHFGTLDVCDYKYGQGHTVSPVKNLQMIFYAIGLAHLYHWNFKRIRQWIIQPRSRGYNGPVFWEVPMLELKNYVGEFKRAVDRVEENPELYVEGGHCHWCKAKSICPAKRETKLENAKQIFGRSPVNGQKESQEESSEESKKGRAQRLTQESVEEKFAENFRGFDGFSGDFY